MTTKEYMMESGNEVHVSGQQSQREYRCFSDRERTSQARPATTSIMERRWSHKYGQCDSDNYLRRHNSIFQQTTSGEKIPLRFGVLRGRRSTHPFFCADRRRSQG